MLMRVCFTNRVFMSAAILLIWAGVCHAQYPTIIPKSQPIVLNLDNKGNINLTPSDVATIIPDNAYPNPTVILIPSSFDCDTRGPQKLIVTAIDAPPPPTFSQPTGIVIDAAGDFYITDAGNHKIRKIDAAGNVTDFAGSGTAGVTDGVGAAAEFDTPQGIAIDAAGNLYVADSKAGLIRKITPAGVVTTIAGTAYSTLDDSGTGHNTTLNQPYGVVVDKQDNVYVSDAVSGRIKKIDPTGFLTNFAGSTTGFADGAALTAQFDIPTGMSIDAEGDIFVADTYNERIREITPAGMVTTVAGNGTQAETAIVYNELDQPNNVLIDAYGNMYIADTQMQLITKASYGNYSTITITAGSGITGNMDGNFADAEFNTPIGMAMDHAGNLYVCDVNNNKIRKIAPGVSVTTFAGTGAAGDVNGGITEAGDHITTDTINVIVTTTLKITTKYNDTTLAVCNLTMPDFVALHPPQTFDNCNNNIPAHQVPAPGTPLTSNAVIPVDIIVEDATGKLDTATFNVYTSSVHPQPTVSITASTTATVCSGTAITFNATTTNTDVVSYQWQVNGNNAGSNQSTFSSTFNDGDAVACNITNSVCAITAASNIIRVKVSPPPVINFVYNNLIIKSGSSVQLDPTITGNNIVSYKWVPADGLSNDTIPSPVASPQKKTTYTLTVTNSTGCDTTGSVTVDVIDIVVIPNAFSPNGDGINDQWNIKGLVLYPGCVVSIFNRYGSLVYHSIGYAVPWDGTYHKSLLPMGTYYYIVDLKNGSPVMSGPVTILK
jgi:gliding motility-associated-like protein